MATTIEVRIGANILLPRSVLESRCKAERDAAMDRLRNSKPTVSPTLQTESWAAVRDYKAAWRNIRAVKRTGGAV